MMNGQYDVNERPDYDPVIQQITDYVLDNQVPSDLAMQTARYCLMDSLACGLLALNYPECTKHLGPIVTGTIVPNGARVPGTSYVLDPIKAAWDIGCIVRWLDFNDTWLAAEWGHPSDNLGAILAVSDYLSQTQPLPVRIETVLQAMVKAHEIQGVLALENSYNRVGLDHVVLVKVASTAVTCWLKGATREQTLAAVSQAWVDGQSLRTYRHAPNAGSRKSWAAGDASSRGVRLADIAMSGEMGIPSVLTAAKWGFYDVLFQGQPFKLARPFANYVMENVLFKIAYPAEFHAQTAVEAAIELYPQVKDKMEQIERIELQTQESAVRIISKVGALNNPADRDHCLQYMVAIGLGFGELDASHYEDAFHAQHPLIDELRAKMQVTENDQFTQAYLDPDKRAIGNAIQVFFNDDSATEKVSIDYPVGHRQRRQQGIPLLLAKCQSALQGHYSDLKAQQIFTLLQSDELLQMPVDKLMNELVVETERSL